MIPVGLASKFIIFVLIYPVDALTFTVAKTSWNTKSRNKTESEDEVGAPESKYLHAEVLTAFRQN
jgi:hypothetical protein